MRIEVTAQPAEINNCIPNEDYPNYLPIMPSIHYYTQRRPWCCPICAGKGFVPLGFYDEIPGTGAHRLSADANNTKPEKCRSCLGLGVIWG